MSRLTYDPASTLPALERPDIISGSVPPADGGIAAECVQQHTFVPVPMSAMVPDAIRIVRDQIEIDKNSPQAVADREFIAALVHECETSGGLSAFTGAPVKK